MSIYEIIESEVSEGNGRISGSEVHQKYDQYPEVIISKGLQYAYGVINEPSTTEFVFHSGELTFAPDTDEEWEELEQITGGFHRSYWVDDEILKELYLDTDQALILLLAYLNAEEKIIAPVFVCGGL